jgi:RsiW-degrading membrane proteinase PrsW (M82 family)
MAETIFIRFFPFILVALGLLPSAAWLLVYLREDVHPEPKRFILKIFFWGMLIAPLAVLAQYVTLSFIDMAGFAAGATVALVMLAGIEEILKYLVVRTEIEDEPVFDEPTDAVVYMIVAALGFAAVENISIAFSFAPSGAAIKTAAIESAGFIDAAKVLGVRFAGATLLHAFSSSIVGWFLAWHFFRKKGLWTICGGIALATALHALFNWLILNGSEVRGITFGLAAVLMIGAIIGIFRSLRNMRTLEAHPQ